MSRFPYNFDRVAPVYEASRALPPGAQEAVRDILVTELGEGRTLEVGVGTGRMARPLQVAGVDVFGVDVSAAMLGEGRHRGLTNTMLANAFQLPFRDASFSHSMMNHVLHLLSPWPAAIREVTRVTDGPLVSVLERSESTPDLSSAYFSAVARDGHDTARPGVHERDLAEHLLPERTVRVGRYTEVQEAGVLIDYLERRSASSQWNVPDRLHSEAISDLRERFGQVRVETSTVVEVVEWSRHQLANLDPTLESRVPRPH